MSTNRSYRESLMKQVVSSTIHQSPHGPVYHVYSHFGCSSNDIDRCKICQYLLQDTTYLHDKPESLFAATRQRSSVPSIRPIHCPVDASNDLYIIPNVPATPRTRRKAEDEAIINICLSDKSIDRIVLIDADGGDTTENDVLYVHLNEDKNRLTRSRSSLTHVKTNTYR